MRWYRVVFSRPGYDDASYNIEARDTDSAWRLAQRVHCGNDFWVGGISIYPGTEPKPDLSITMDELADLAIDLNSRHGDVPF